MVMVGYLKRSCVALVLCCLFGRVAAWCNDVNPLARMASTVYAKEVTYDSSGNILSKTGTGSYDYDGPRPHAVTETDMLGSADSIGVAYTYNALGKIELMEKGVPRDSTIATYEYGPDGERWKNMRVQSNDYINRCAFPWLFSDDCSAEGGIKMKNRFVESYLFHLSYFIFHLLPVVEGK